MGNAVIRFTPGRPDVCVSLPSTACSALGEHGFRRVLSVLFDLDAHFTRVDVAITDSERLAEPADLHAADLEDRLVSRARRTEEHADRFDKVLETFTLGSKHSRCRLRVYDKGRESRSIVSGVRWELQARREAARALAAQLHHHEEWGDVVAGAIVSFVDILDAPSGDRVPWFHRLIRTAAQVSLYEIRPPGQVVSRGWLENSVARQLAMVLREDGGDMSYIFKLIAIG